METGVYFSGGGSLSADLKASRDWYSVGSQVKLFQSLMVRGKKDSEYDLSLVFGCMNLDG